MSYEKISDILKNCDGFGTRFYFYIERNRKLYTPLGGIFTLLSCIFGIIIFIYINLDDFIHNMPNSTTSTERNNHQIIKFKEEKIWIPWRIRNFGGKTVNHTNILYPIIYYYKAKRDNEIKSMITTYEFINYKLCNETSMVNNTDLYMIDIELDQLYCIDMEDLNMGGGWDSDFLFLVTFDLYACKNGIDYDENNSNCTTYERIAEIAGNNNCFEFEIYYPIVHYQPLNKTKPIFVEYKNDFYHLSRYTNKIDRLYLQQHILIDDKGWFLKDEEIISRWGCVSLNGDSYSNGKKRDLMNEGSTSRFYSFNIYLNSDVIYYNRSYKKRINLIFSEGLPIVNIIFIIFRFIAKVFKISSENKKIIELLFENIKEKKTFMKINKKNMNSIKINNYINDFSSVQLTPHTSGKKIILENNNNSIVNSNNFIKDENNIINKYNIQNKIGRSFNNSLVLDKNKILNKNIHNINLFKNKSNDLSNLQFNNRNTKIDYNSQNNKNTDNNIFLNTKPKIRYIKQIIFPYKYYLYSIFIKNCNDSKKAHFITKKFTVVNNFISQLFDISSYLILQREFQTMKNTIIGEKQRSIIEKGQKINISDKSFNINMKECLEKNKLSILGRINYMKELDYY